jgi:FixJ family two-component response regulator
VLDVEEVKEPVVVGVDDDVRIRESIARLAKSAGYAAIMFPSAEAVLASGTLGGAGCLISDVRMPGMDGLELQRRVRAENPGLPVILISGHMDEQVRERALREGAVAFLFKPFDGEELLRLIQRNVDHGSQT